MDQSIPEPLRFPPVAGLTVRAEFDGGAMSSDFGSLILRGVDRQIGLIDRLTSAVDDQRHPSYITHPLRDLLAQRIFQIACGYADGNDANTLRTDPLFELGVDRHPLARALDLASGPTFSRLENAMSTQDIYRLARAFVDQFITRDLKPPAVIVLDMDHSEDPTHGQQEFSFYNHYYGHDCYLPLFLFEGLSGKFITAALRPGQRPTGAENAMIVKRVAKRLRAAWPQTRIVLRGDAHFANPELMQLAVDDPNLDFIFGLAGNRALSPLAEPFLAANRQGYALRVENARRAQRPLPIHTRTDHEIAYVAASWPQAFRVILKAEVIALGDHPRFVVTSLDLPTPECLYRDLYSARGQDENFIKMVKSDWASDRTSDHRFLANPLRLFFILRGLRLASGAACRGAGPYRTGQGPTGHCYPQVVQAGGAGGGVQGSDQTALTDELSGQRPPAPSHRPPVPEATAAAAPRLTPAVNTHSGTPKARWGRQRAARLAPPCPSDPLRRPVNTGNAGLHQRSAYG